jgi:hypothetical protein
MTTKPPIPGKMAKSRSRTAVKPILKKLQSHSEKNSLDLDRGWEEQTAEFGYGYGSTDYYYGSKGRDDDGTTAGLFAPVNPRLSNRDVSFSLSAADAPGGGGGGVPATSIKYSHARSTSGTSHVSIATTGSGRNGSFVHPFQQTPRTSTPPLSYANSLVSLDNSAPPGVINEDDPYDELEHSSSSASAGAGAATTATSTSTYTTKHPRSYFTTTTNSNPRRPSLVSQRTSSLSDVNQPLRTYTSTRSASGSGSGSPAVRMTSQGSLNQSQTDIYLNPTLSLADSPPLSSTTTPYSSAPLTAVSPTSSVSAAGLVATSSANTMSPIRSSLDGFRMRSRSDMDTATRQEHVRQARRKFDEKEKAKEEKYAREQVKKRERADTKEAQRIERGHGQVRKGSFGTSGIASCRTSSSTEARPSGPRKSTSNNHSSTTRLDDSAEKLGFSSRGYDSVASGQSPQARTDDADFDGSARKTRTAKHKTTSTWTAFVLWFRTRLLKIGRR